MKIDYGWKSPSDFRRWGPYLSYGIHAATEMNITWQSKFFSLTQWLEYGETPQCGTRLEKKETTTTLHSFHLTGLKPDTLYYYKISRIEDIKEEKIPIYNFKTGPIEGTPAPVDFCVIADLHASYEDNTQQTFQNMIRSVPNLPFIVTAGDCVDHGGVEERWNTFFHQLIPYTSRFVLMNATGNHDTDHPETYAHFVQTFQNPYHDPNQGAFYYFIYGNMVFIMLDSTNAGQSAATQGVVSDYQLQWLEDTLKQFGKKNYWIFVLMHHPVYSTGDSGMMNLYELAYKDLFEEYHVDVVFYGHDHLFEVYWAARDKDWGGTHYCLIGNAGGSLGDFIRDPNRKSPYLWKGRTYIPKRDGILGGTKAMRNDEIIKEAMLYGIIEHGFTQMHIEGDKAELKMIGWQNQTYFKETFNRTSHGKKFHEPEFVQEF